MTSESSRSINPRIDVDYVYPSIDAAFADFRKLPFYEGYSPQTQQMTRYAFYCGIAEIVRLISHRINADQNMTVLTELDNELRAYEREFNLPVH